MSLLSFSRRFVAAASVILAASPAGAQWSLFESDFDEEKKPWVEIEAQIPANPKPENLIAFDAGSATGHRFYIDAPSLSVGEDGVVRYTMVIRTSGGATNATFEGIRCATREQKLYAVASAEGKWARARDPRWKRIETREVHVQHGVLYQEYFCPQRHLSKPSVKQIVQELKRGGSLRPPSGG